MCAVVLPETRSPGRRRRPCSRAVLRPGNERCVRRLCRARRMPGGIPDNRERAFAEYFSRRKANADALADLAIANFIEMRDKTASRTFRAKKNSITCSKPRCPEFICRSIPWSPSRVSLRRGRASRATTGSDRLRQPYRYRGALDWDLSFGLQVDQKPDGVGDGLVKLCSSSSSSSMSAVMMWMLIGSIGAVICAAGGK